MAMIDVIKANIFATPMPDMPPLLREIWQVAFMYRRKYSNPVDVDPNSFFLNAWSDAQYIAQSYGNNETVQALMVEVYSDIERQYLQAQAEKAERDRVQKAGADDGK